MSLALRVAARHQQRQADQPASARSDAQRNTTPINAPRGIQHDIVKDNARTVDMGHGETVEPHRHDIRPKDVFNLSPSSGGVLNLAQTGQGLSKALNNQVPHDKGYETVSNLSQYLIRTEGGGGTPPVGK